MMEWVRRGVHSFALPTIKKETIRPPKCKNKSNDEPQPSASNPTPTWISKKGCSHIMLEMWQSKS